MCVYTSSFFSLSNPIQSINASVLISNLALQRNGAYFFLWTWRYINTVNNNNNGRSFSLEHIGCSFLAK